MDTLKRSLSSSEHSSPPSKPTSSSSKRCSSFTCIACAIGVCGIIPLVVALVVLSRPLGRSDSQVAQVITGLYGSGSSNAQIVIHGVDGSPTWTWSVDDAAGQENIPKDLLACIQQHTAVPEAKWANDGKSVISIYNYAALMINHLPGDSKDKQVTFGVCLNTDDMANTHSLELAPDGKLAIATTSDYMEGNIKIFDMSSGLQAESSAAQQLNSLPAVHSLVWDEHARLLWGVGSSNAPDGEQESRSALNAYRYTGGTFQEEPVYSYNISKATVLTTEWADTEYAGWWDGGHDMTGLPGKRKLIISTDTELHAFNIDAHTFETGQTVVDKYLPGFKPVDDRVGSDGSSLPRSDIKSLSIDRHQNALYIQAAWQDVVSYQINVLQGGQIQPAVSYDQQLYRSRWFAETPAWPKAKVPN